MNGFWAQLGSLLLPLLIGTFIGTLLRPRFPSGRWVQLAYLGGAVVTLVLFVDPSAEWPAAFTFAGRVLAGAFFGLYSPPWRRLGGKQRTPEEDGS